MFLPVLSFVHCFCIAFTKAQMRIEVGKIASGNWQEKRRAKAWKTIQKSKKFLF